MSGGLEPVVGALKDFAASKKNDVLSVTNTSWARADATNLQLVLDAAVGDVLEIALSARCQNEANWTNLDAATIVSNAIVNHCSGDSTNGVAAWFALGNEYLSLAGSIQYTVQAADVVNGTVTVALVTKGSSSSPAKTFGIPMHFSVKNLGQVGGWAAVSGAGLWTEVARTVLGSAATSIDLTAIPATYDHLRLVVKARSTDAAAAVNLVVRFNGDTGTNYDWTRIQGGGGSADATQAYAATSGVIGVIPGGGALANLFGIATAEIPEYTATDWQKMVSSQSAHRENTSSGAQRSGLYATSWRSTAAINRVTVLASSGDLVAGSAVSLYGIGMA